MNLNWYKLAQETPNYPELFRWDSSPIDMENYDPEYATKELGKELGASMSYGPGIYFANKKDVAEMYGSNITKKTLHNAKILTIQSPLFKYSQIEKILQGVDKVKLEMAISNWDENYKIGKRMLIESIINADSPLDQLMNIWAAAFYHQNPNDFITLMIKNGIDGISLQKEDVTYYVIYNKNVLK